MHSASLVGTTNRPTGGQPPTRREGTGRGRGGGVLDADMHVWRRGLPAHTTFPGGGAVQLRSRALPRRPRPRIRQRTVSAPGGTPPTTSTAPSAPVDLSRLASDVIAHATPPHPPGGCAAASGAAPPRQARVHVHDPLSPARAAAPDVRRPPPDRRPRPSGRAPSPGTPPRAPRPRRRSRRRSGHAVRAHPIP